MNTDNFDLVSVIVPIYNVERYLKKCLESILNQTYNNIEVICVNDGSIDESQSIVDNFLCDRRFTSIKQKNNGISSARNTGIKHTNGRYIMFVDSDDWLHEDCINQCLNEIGDADIVFFPYMKAFSDRFQKQDLIIDAYNTENLSEQVVLDLIGPSNQALAKPHLLDSKGTVHSKLYTHDVISGLEFVSLNEIGSSEDTLFNISAFSRAKKVRYLDNPLYFYRKNRLIDLILFRNGIHFTITFLIMLMMILNVKRDFQIELLVP